MPPLLSLLTAAISSVTGIPLLRIAVFLPPLLGILLVLPVFFLGRHLGGTVCGLLSALFAATSGYYLYRSSLGFFDTLMSCSAASTSSEMSEEALAEAGIPPGLVRISNPIAIAVEVEPVRKAVAVGVLAGRRLFVRVGDRILVGITPRIL